MLSPHLPPTLPLIPPFHHTSPHPPISSQLARHVINPLDDALLKYNFDDNNRIEPEWYLPIIPMVLINGAEGIGTGWSTKVPNYDIREIVNNIRSSFLLLLLLLCVFVLFLVVCLCTPSYCLQVDA